MYRQETRAREENGGHGAGKDQNQARGVGIAAWKWELGLISQGLWERRKEREEEGAVGSPLPRSGLFLLFSKLER